MISMTVRDAIRRTAAFGTVFLAVGVVAGGASAHRAARPAESAAMIYHASGRYYGGGDVSEPASIPLRCFDADIATVRAGSNWGAWRFSNYAYESQHERLCGPGNGWSVEHRIRGRWYVLWEGDEGYPPTRNTREGRIVLQGVPRAIAMDLQAGLR